jgi:hypothetical protein
VAQALRMPASMRPWVQIPPKKKKKKKKEKE